MANYWQGSDLTLLAMNRTLQEAFDGELLALTTPEGNSIAFAFDSGLPLVREPALLQAAERLGRTMGVPLRRHARARERTVGPLPP